MTEIRTTQEAGALRELLPKQRDKHAAQAKGEACDLRRLLVAQRADGLCEIDRGDDLAETIAGDGEVPFSHAWTIVREAFAKLKKRARRGARGLVTQLGISDFRLVYRDCKLLGDAVRIHFWKRE